MDTVTVSRPSRILSGHLWVFSNELSESPKRFAPGALVELRDRKGAFLGIGYINPHSLIAARILTRKSEGIDEAFFRRRIEEALAYRRRFLGGRSSFRAVYSESDFLPGLVVDKYAGCLSVQFLTFGMEAMAGTIIKVLDEVFSPSAIVLRNDSSIRTLEGLPLEKKVVKGSLDELPVIDEDGVKITVDPYAGQKTGFFLDQFDNRTAFAALSGGGTGLDLFCYTGPWSLRLAKKGFAMKGVDSSEHAVALAEANARANGLSESCSFVKADVFDLVKKELSAGARYDRIVLDPPAFVKSKARIAEALRAYRELNAACLALLKPGGLIATSSCSYHIDRPAFMEMLRSAAKDSGRRARVIETRAQSKDHPISLAVPETEYLKCVILEAL